MAHYYRSFLLCKRHFCSYYYFNFAFHFNICFVLRQPLHNLTDFKIKSGILVNVMKFNCIINWLIYDFHQRGIYILFIHESETLGICFASKWIVGKCIEWTTACLQYEIVTLHLNSCVCSCIDRRKNLIHTFDSWMVGDVWINFVNISIPLVFLV